MGEQLRRSCEEGPRGLWGGRWEVGVGGEQKRGGGGSGNSSVLVFCSCPFTRPSCALWFPSSIAILRFADESFFSCFKWIIGELISSGLSFLLID